MMNILILGDQARFENYMPEFVSTLPVKLTYFASLTPLETVIAAASQTDIILADAVTPVPEALIQAAPSLKMIHSDGVGYNAIDAEAARRQNVYVCNCKGCNADAVAEAAVMLMLMVTRFAVPGYRAVIEDRQMPYKEHIMRSAVPEFADHSIGLIGLGDIARATIKRLQPFGNRLYYYTLHRRTAEEEAALGLTWLPLEELATVCDILSLHCAVTPETTGMVDEKLLARMKPGSYLINTSRGQLVDNEAVRAALLSGHLAGAGFDTLWPEPTPASHPLVDLPQEIRERVAYLPHLGGNTGPSFTRAYRMVWENVRRILQEERPSHIVNGL